MAYGILTAVAGDWSDFGISNNSRYCGRAKLCDMDNVGVFGLPTGLKSVKIES